MSTRKIGKIGEDIATDYLKSKGYKIKYIQFKGWQPWSNSRKTFPDGLMNLIGKN